MSIDGMVPVVRPEEDSFARHLMYGPQGLNRWAGARLADAQNYGKVVAQLAGVTSYAIVRAAWEVITSDNDSIPDGRRIDQNEIVSKTDW